MLIPALFVADAAKTYQSASRNEFDIIVFTEPADVDEGHRTWMRQRGIIHCDDMGVSDLSAGVLLQERLTPATLMKSILGISVLHW